MSESQPTRPRRIALGRAIPVTTLPNVIEVPFPERRTIHWLPPDRVTTNDFSIVITSEVLLQTSLHVSKTLNHEMGGFLLGNRYHCPNTGRDYIRIDQYVEADYTESTDVSLTFTHEAWGQLEDKLTGKFYGKKLVGWYHSHPRMSVFLSEHDIVLHKGRFAEPWMVALVLEPEKHLGGFFVWSDGKIDPNRYVNFYEEMENKERESVVAWTNYDGLDPAEGAAPVLAAVNTLTIQPAGNQPLPNGDAAAQSTGGSSPYWLKGNVAWFGAAALALFVFLGALGGVFLWRRGGAHEVAVVSNVTPAGDTKPAVNNEPLIEEPTRTTEGSPTEKQGQAAPAGRQGGTKKLSEAEQKKITAQERQAEARRQAEDRQKAQQEAARKIADRRRAQEEEAKRQRDNGRTIQWKRELDRLQSLGTELLRLIGIEPDKKKRDALKRKYDDVQRELRDKRKVPPESL